MPYADRAKQLAYHKAYNALDKRKDRKREYREANREQLKLMAAKWRAAHPTTVKQSSARYYVRNKLKIKWQASDYLLRRNYNITAEDWARLFEKQKGLCAGCGARLAFAKGTHVDHHHRSSKVRGLLCNSCNRTLGQVHDRPRVLYSLARYLEDSGAFNAD